jgi:cytoplasmic iron level regulating protein YaaA (DUF328/UPF0246 family)
MRPAAVFILSAKYGLVQPTDEIEPYDVTLNTMSVAQVKAWSEQVFGQLKASADVERDHFIFLAGMRYRQHLVPKLRSVAVPMEHLGIGQQLQFLKSRLA